MRNNILLTMLSCFMIANLCAQSYDFKTAINNGANPAGIYSIEFNKWHSGKKYSLKKLKKFLNKKGYNLVDYDFDIKDNKVYGFAFSKKYTNKEVYSFNVDLTVSNDEESTFMFPNDNEYLEKAGNRFVSIKLNGSKSKLTYGNDGKVFGKSIPNKYSWISEYLCDDRKLLVYEKHELEMKTLTDQYILNYDFENYGGAKYRNSYKRYGNSLELMTSKYISLLDKEMEYILNSSHMDYSKVLVFLIRIQPWLKGQFGSHRPTKNLQGWSRDKYGMKVRRHVINTYYNYFDKMVKNEKQFVKSENLRRYITLLSRAEVRIWNSELYEEYIKNKKEELNRLVAKEMSDKMAENRKLAEGKNIMLRHTFNKGIIGKDYVPPVTGYYNAGKKYKVGDIEIQEDDYRKYVREGGYNKDVEGYTAVYQIINNSSDYQLVEVDISCTGKFSDITRRSWLSQLANWTASNYKTNVEQRPIKQNVTYIVKPKSALKDQVIVGEDQPTDFIFTVPKIVTVSKEWIDQLDLAISGSNLQIVDRYLKDEKAKAWRNKINKNKQRIIKVLEKEFSDRYIKDVSASIKIVNELLYDEDFESEVNLIIENTSEIPLMVSYNCPFLSETIKIEANSKYEKRHSIKGVSKPQLKVKLLKVSRVN